jgi:hypothetical protein
LYDAELFIRDEVAIEPPAKVLVKLLCPIHVGNGNDNRFQFKIRDLPPVSFTSSGSLFEI